MTEKMMCFSCEQERDVQLFEQMEIVTLKGREIKFLAEMYRCNECGNQFETAGQLDANLEAAREEYSRLYESFTPEQLVALRNSYNASQKAFGLLLGFGELTMNTYEKGSLPNSTNRLLIRLAEDPYSFRKMYEINKNRIGETQRKRIEASDGFKDTLHWEFMDPLYHSLSAEERRSVERQANASSITVSHYVATCVSKSIQKDYASMINKAQWQKTDKTSLSTPSDQIINQGLAG